jgi:signal transduction histidine kinase
MKKTRPLFWFYILVAYVFIQFAWWTYELFQLNNEIYQLKTELNLFKGESSQDIINKGNEMNHKLHKRWIMISSEGAVFVGLLLLGILQTRKTNKKELDLARQQKNFILSITHELKSPIASAKLQLQTLLKHELPKEKQKEIIENAIHDTERLNTLVENILFVSKIENSVTALLKEACNVSELLNTIIEKNTKLYFQHHQIKTVIEPDIILKIDKNAFPSIVVNLIENAVKYSEKNTTVEIILKKQNNKIIFSVADQGIGIEDKEKQKVIEKFYRVGNEEVRNTKGTGLGLYIVNYLVKEHGGKLQIKNNVPKGSVFEIEFDV